MSNHSIKTHSKQDISDMKFAMRISFIIGVVILFIKIYAYLITGSVSVLSDATESIIHVIAVAFAAYSLSVSLMPANNKYLYGKNRIAFFSAGFEGVLISIAGLCIIYTSVLKWINGLTIDNIDSGLLFTGLSILINGILGIYLIRKGKKHNSIVLEANGKHVFADCLTSVGVVMALFLVYITGWLPFDPIIAIILGIHIMWIGGKLIKRSIDGLMDTADKITDDKLRNCLDVETKIYNIDYHNLKHRYAGNKIFVECHLLFPAIMTISEAHDKATSIEKSIERLFELPVEVITHLEPLENHDSSHD